MECSKNFQCPAACPARLPIHLDDDAMRARASAFSRRARARQKTNMSDAMKKDDHKYLDLLVTHRGACYCPRRAYEEDRTNGKKLVPRRDPGNPWDSNCINLLEPNDGILTCNVGKEYARLISPLVDRGVLDFVDATVVDDEWDVVSLRVRVLREPSEDDELDAFEAVLKLS